jgi:RNA polymerase sigma factor (sigma-70 family)
MTRLRLSDPLLRLQTDERLAALAGHGGERAFAILVERHRTALLAFARRLGANGNAEDVVQQALLQAWSALERGTEVRHVSAWLRQSVRNAAIRAAARQGDDAELPATLAAATETADEVELRERTRALLSEIERLPTRQREALLQLAVVGSSGAEVGAGMELEANAVRQLAHRARTRLRAAVGALVPWPVALAAARGTHGLRIVDGLPELVGGASVAGGAGAGLGGAGLVKLGAVATTTAVVAAGAVGLGGHPASHRRAARPAPSVLVARASAAARRGGSEPAHGARAGAPSHAAAPVGRRRPNALLAPVALRRSDGGEQRDVHREDRSSSGSDSSGSGDRTSTSGSGSGSGDGTSGSGSGDRSTTQSSSDGGSSTSLDGGTSSTDGGTGSTDGGGTTTTSGSDGGAATSTSTSDGGSGSSDGGTVTTTTTSGGDG